MANNTNINYDDERFTENEEAKQTALTDTKELYDNQIQDSDSYYQNMVNASEEWKNTQTDLQQQNTDLMLQQIEQQKQQANKDYQKEQSGAYVDWQKQSNQFGANAEQMAASGMGGTGYSESSNVSMYNTYQNRVSMARESYNKAVLNYNNSMKEAILQNNTALATIAYQALQQQLELSLQSFQYKNQLLEKQQQQLQQIEDRYYGRYQDIVSQINTENAMAEQIRQYEQNYTYQQERDRIADEQWNKEYQLTLDQIAKENSGGGGGYIGGGDGGYIDDGNGGVIPDGNGNGYTAGNSAETMNKADYYFSNGYQPRYINNTKLNQSGTKTDVLPKELGIPAGQNIWQAGDKYYAWDGKKKQYINVTKKISFSNGYQPKYINNKELKESGLKTNILSKKLGIPSGQKIWQAGKKYYAWYGAEKRYIDVTSQVKEYNKDKNTRENVVIDPITGNVLIVR